MSATDQPKYYRFSFRGVKLDPYRIIQVYGIVNPAQQHAIKKLLRAGESVKSLVQDIDEVILALNRWKEMLEEENIETRLNAVPKREIRVIEPTGARGGHPVREWRNSLGQKIGVEPNRRRRRRIRVRPEVEK
jgi:hypothetical protein